MSMSRKDYTMIADVLRERNDPSLTARLADAFAEANPRFDREKFMQAAEGEQE